MPEGSIPRELNHLIEAVACFDEFQNFGIDPEEDQLFEDTDISDEEISEFEDEL